MANGKLIVPLILIGAAGALVYSIMGGGETKPAPLGPGLVWESQLRLDVELLDAMGISPTAVPPAPVRVGMLNWRGIFGGLPQPADAYIEGGAPKTQFRWYAHMRAIKLLTEANNGDSVAAVAQYKAALYAGALGAAGTPTGDPNALMEEGDGVGTPFRKSGRGRGRETAELRRIQRLGVGTRPISAELAQIIRDRLGRPLPRG